MQTRRAELQYCGSPFPCGPNPPGVCDNCTDRTSLQIHCNYMLRMRRTMKMLAEALRFEYSVFGRGYWRMAHSPSGLDETPKVE